MIDVVGGGKKSGEKNIFFFWRGKKNRENVVEKCGEVIEKKLDKKCAGQKISLFFNDNSTNRSIRWDEERSYNCYNKKFEIWIAEEVNRARNWVCEK